MKKYINIPNMNYNKFSSFFNKITKDFNLRIDYNDIIIDSKNNKPDEESFIYNLKNKINDSLVTGKYHFTAFIPLIHLNDLLIEFAFYYKNII